MLQPQVVYGGKLCQTHNTVIFGGLNLSKKYNAVANAEENASQAFVKGAAILTVSMVIVKVFGLLDKVILADIYSMFGDSFASMGVGLYNNAYEIFVLIFTVATGGLPIVISRLISQNMAEKRYKDVKQIHKLSIPIFLAVGLVCMLGMLIVSFPYAFNVIKSPYAVYAMMALAPTILFGCLTSIYRGYFEGQRNMFPTAVSEVIEAVVKLVLGALFAFLIMKFGMESYRQTHSFLFFHFKNHMEAHNTILAFSVAGNICGISIASFCSFLYLLLKYRIGGDGIPKQYLEASVDARRQKETLGIIIKTALPIVGGTLVMSIGSIVDAAIIQNVLYNMAHNNADALFSQYHKFYPHEVFYGEKTTIHTSLWGCYGSSLTLMQLVTAVTQVFGSSAMPNVTSAWTKGNKQELKSSIDTVLKMTMMFTLPMALGLSVLSHEVMGFIYSSPDIINIGGNVLTLMGITTIFTAIITPICSMLNGIGKVKLPMILYTICMLVKIGTSWIFVSIPEINIQGATAGSLISYALICVVGMYLLVKYSKVVPNFFSTTVKPLIGAVASSAAAYFVNLLLKDVVNHRIATIVAIVAAAIVYIAILLIIKTFRAEEIKILPKGEKIAKTLEKWHLIG